MALPPNKQRSRRQRKKMRIGEFQEFGFEYELKVKAELSPEQEEALMDRFAHGPAAGPIVPDRGPEPEDILNS